jgi:hypothetical protein
MDAALDGPPQAPAPEIIKHEMVTPVAKPVEIRPMHDIITSLTEEKKAIVSDASANTMAPVVATAEPEWNEDTSGWFTEESRLSKTLEARDWPHFASEVVHMLLENAFTLSLDPSDLLRPEDVRLFLNTAIKYLPTLCEDLAPVLADVRWSVLPARFQKQLEIEVADKMMRNGASPKYKAKHPVAKAFCEMISFFRDGKRHISWKTMPVTFRELEMFKTSPLAFTEVLMTEWWNGERTTDEIREFMIKLTALRFFVNSPNKSTTVGSAEFLDQFFKHVTNLALPKDFISWAIKGTTHRHCKKALQELEIQQARRAEGQRYVGLEEIKDPLDEESSKYSYEFNYELCEPFGPMMSDSLTTLDCQVSPKGSFVEPVGEPGQICLLALYDWKPPVAGPPSKMFSLKAVSDGH